ncbi:MAG: HDIG domain-containing protein [Kiritimatiellae bacterium]|nr:HDIG domain-containing protein [Kiritimatiellia bacterium]
MRWFFRRREPHDWVLAQQRRKEKEAPKSWHRIWLYNVGILLLMWLVGVGVLSLGGEAFDANLSEGQVAPKTVVATVEFQCRDLQRTALNKQRAGEAAVPLFRMQLHARDKAWRDVDKLAEMAITSRARYGAKVAVVVPETPAGAVAAAEGDGSVATAPEGAAGSRTSGSDVKAGDEGTVSAAKPKRKKGGAAATVVAPAEPAAAKSEPIEATPAAEPVAPAPAPEPVGPVQLVQPGDSPEVIFALQRTADLLELQVAGADLAKLFPNGLERESADAVKAAAERVLRLGVVSDTELEFVGPKIAASTAVDILIPEANGTVATQRVAAAELLREGGAADRIAEALRPLLEERGVEDIPGTARALAAALAHASIKYDQEATRARQVAAASGVGDAVMTVFPGTTILEERAEVKAQNIEMLSAYNRKLAELETPLDRTLKHIGDYLMMLVVLIACVGWLRSVQPGVYSKSRRKWLLVLLGLLSLGIELLYHWMSTVRGFLPGWVVPYAMPMTLVPTIAVLMLGPEAGLAAGLWVALSSALIFGRSFEFMFIGIAASVSAVAMLRSNVRRRSQIMRAGLVVGCVNSLVAIVMALLNRHTGATFRGDLIASFSSGIVSSVVVTVLLPVLEWAFGHTTDISLLELTDQSHPLLQRLSLEAPGTYHHSRMVAAIGQAAADRIGADGLLVAVCASFHDIGKLAKPEFFTENQRGGENPHDSLSPSMSALLIQSHVKEGLTLAKRYRLPAVVCDAIQAHHGTSRISYFYQMAVNDLKARDLPEDPALEASFRYEGPRPWTKEQAVLVLADTVEAASRSLEKITPSRISEMVDRLVRDKLLDGQLDEAPLTLADLNTVRDSFVFTLTNILHGRSAYPNANPPATTPAIPPPASPPPEPAPASAPATGAPDTAPLAP